MGIPVVVVAVVVAVVVVVVVAVCCVCCLHIKSPFLPSFIRTPSSVRPDSLS